MLRFAGLTSLLFLTLFATLFASAAPRKAHSVVLGAVRHVPYSKAGDPASAVAGESVLDIRALLVDGVLKEWTTGEAHDVTDRSFVVRRVIRLNDTLPTDGQPGTPEKAGPEKASLEKASPEKADLEKANPDKATLEKASPEKARPDKANQWVWQRGPWLLVDRAAGHVTALRLPDYDPGVSQVSWFRDYAAYCGVTASGKSLYAVVAQIAARKPVLAKKLAAFDVDNHPDPVCAPADWQREPLRIAFHPAGTNAISYDIVPGSALLVEDTADEDETPSAALTK
jgi:hypothetical protein